MTMVDKVARAIAQSDGIGDAEWDAMPPVAKTPFLAFAKAAIEAMRMPDEQMLNAVGAVATSFWTETWAKMIDAALGEQDT
jgi:hypothetical protein